MHDWKLLFILSGDLKDFGSKQHLMDNSNGGLSGVGLKSLAS